MEARRIAVVIDYSLDTLGGAETAFFEQVAILGRHVETTAYSSAAHRLTHLARYPGVSVREVPIWFTTPVLGFPFSVHDARMRDFFVREFTQRKPQVVHIHSEFAMGVAAQTAAHELGIPVVHTIHTFFWQSKWPIQRLLALGVPLYHHLVTGLKPTRERLADAPGDSALRNMTLTVAQRSDAIVSPSQHQADRLAEAGLGPIFVIPNAMTCPDAEPLSAVEPPLRVLWVGRMRAEKRVLPFIAAARRALERVPPGSLIVDVVGAGDQYHQAVELADGRPEIVMHGQRVPSAVHKMVAASHITALTSIGWDNQPMVVVESISALRGVIFCDPVLTEGLRGPGIAAFGDTEKELARVLVELVADPSPVVAASQAALTARQEFSEEAFADRSLNAYRDVMGRAASA